ncbi:HutD/Ves family protein [Leeia oryzae]|uniref:HutD/Ves family protein n=1 Tax=Leeia oryzae TaxID=356662 RepID=UPI00036EA5E6|nr:HutD family protein [Leeia oryzae]
MQVTQIKATDLTPMPWKNGGGVTREVAVWPTGAGLEDFVWRISLAEVAQSGPFSRFEGIDRVLVLVEGQGMELADAEGSPTLLQSPGDALRFPGEASITSTLHHGTTHDFNLMWRRSLVKGDVTICESSQLLDLLPGTHLLHAIHDSMDIHVPGHGAWLLAAGDSLLIETSQPQRGTLTKNDSGFLIHAHIRAS